MKTCTIDECGRKHLARGYCGKHYQRWRKHGDPHAGWTVYRDTEQRFVARVAWDGEHLIWVGGTYGEGYGHIWNGERLVGAHRFSWERDNGEIPDGRVIDHVCHTPACVLPAHLRLATHQQNMQNLSGPRRGTDLPRGVTRSGERYTAAVKHNGKCHYLGTFSTPEEASEAAATKRSILFGEYAGAN